MSTASRVTVETLEEQRTWVGEQLDAAVAASGVSTGWSHSYSEEVRWAEDRPEDRRKTLRSLVPGNCGTQGGRVSVSLINTEAEDPLAAALAVRAFWESEGWSVTDILSYAAADEPYFRADREDGAELALMVASGGLALEVASACSVHSTVTNWESH